MPPSGTPHVIYDIIRYTVTWLPETVCIWQDVITLPKLSAVVFKSPVRSGYWVPNMVTKALTG